MGAWDLDIVVDIADVLAERVLLLMPLESLGTAKALRALDDWGAFKLRKSSLHIRVCHATNY